MNIQKNFAIILTALSLTGCSREITNIAPPAEFMQKPESIVLARTSGIENAQYNKFSHSGLVGMIIDDAFMGDLEKKVNEFSSSSIIEDKYYKNFSNALQDKKFQVMIEDRAINKTKLQNTPLENANSVPYDFRYLKDKYNVNYALILLPKSFEVLRGGKDGRIPTHIPLAKVDLDMYLINLNNNSILAKFHSSTRESAWGEWNMPPNYPIVIKSARRALENALDEAYVFFFKKDPL